MIEKIYLDQDLFALIRQDCKENDVGATFAQELINEYGDLKDDRIIILKLDAFYSSSNMPNPPPSPDYLVIVRCCDNSLDGYIIELRDTTQTAAVRAKEIVKKFKTIAEDFFGKRYKSIFIKDNGSIIFRSLKLYLVTDPLGLRSKNLSDDEYKKRIRGTTLDAYGTLEPLIFGTRPYIIEPVLPDPVVKSC